MAIGAPLALIGCGGGSNDDELASTSPDSTGATADPTEAPEDASADSGTIVVGGPNGYTLEVQEFAEFANWWYDSSTVTAVLCGELTADRTLRIYRSTDTENRRGVFCEDGGGSILSLQAGRELEQPDQDGAIQMANGDIGVIIAGGDTFGKSGIGTVTVEVRSAADQTSLPATLNVEVTADTGQVMFVFSAPAES
jgi:hypothetical protein